jgi:hypothetical protein
MASTDSRAAQTAPRSHSEVVPVSAGDYVAQSQIDQRLVNEPRNAVIPPLESDLSRERTGKIGPSPKAG